MAQPTLPLWEDEPLPDHRSRIVARSSDRFAWLRARSQGVTATDVARLSSAKALQSVAQDKILGSGFSGNAYTDHGRAREPEIAKWVRAEHRIEPSDALFHAYGERSHLATPDGLAELNGTLVLAEIKTTASAWKSIPRSYLRQVWWQQYVLGAERTLVVWEQHLDFVPISTEPKCRWVDRDDNEIHQLVGLADQLLRLIRR
ncbi:MULTISPECIES: YqaJ viral recombinase family protein [unclassified Salinibacterium]|uniref:YqaJ viral recombinase family protein n=1 Tax=Salinibacterium sp. ZJ454 TaxID=2708339 RepID=UPI00174DBDF2|nr:MULTISPECIES: YqaJ viral recombinase family protein [unclassified Salinibacterium]